MKYYYRIDLQFLGYRYHGWMTQPGVKTVQDMVDKTIAFIFQGARFKTFGSGRTDAKVSAAKFGVYLHIDQAIDLTSILPVLNKNLPGDIRAMHIQAVDVATNPLNSSQKHYMYLFAFNEKPHPFSASMVHTEPTVLNLDQMTAGAELFEGLHNFKKYCTKPKAGTEFMRRIDHCTIQENDLYSASFFPENTYALHVKSAGFMRYQVRLMMGQLFALGRGEISLKDIENSLNPVDDQPLRHIAPGSGLILQDVVLAE